MESFISSCDNTLSEIERQDVLEKIFFTNVDTTTEMILKDDFPTETTIRNGIAYSGWKRVQPSLTYFVMAKPYEGENK